MKRNSAVRRAVFRTPLPGRQLIFWGTLALFAVAAWEFYVRFEDLRAFYAFLQNLKKINPTITNRQLLEALKMTPEMRDLLARVAYLAACGVFALIAHVLRRCFVPCFLIIPCCALLALYPQGGSVPLSVFNWFPGVLAASSCAVALGAGVNIFGYYTRRAAYQRRLREKRARQQKLDAQNQRYQNARASSLAPKRQLANPPKRRAG